MRNAHCDDIVVCLAFIDFACTKRWGKGGGEGISGFHHSENQELWLTVTTRLPGIKMLVCGFWLKILKDSCLDGGCCRIHRNAAYTCSRFYVVAE